MNRDEPSAAIRMKSCFASISLLALAACAGTASDADTLSGGTSLTVSSHGEDRKLILHALPADAPQPLVMIFHGGGGSAGFMAQRTRSFTDQMLDRGYAVAFMNGSSRLGGRNLRTWNGGHCCAYAMRTGIDEVDYIDRAVAAIAARLSLDRSRIFLMGHSNGGMVAYQAAADMGTAVRGIVVISSAMFGDQPRLPQGISAFLTHALDDDNIAFDALSPPKQQRAWDAPPLPFLEAELALVDMLNCGDPERKGDGKDIAMRIRHCAGQAELAVVVSAAGGHGWPKVIPGFSLEHAILEFLDRQQ